MDEKELVNLVYSHQYTDDEKLECMRIVQLLEQEGFTDLIGCGFPYDDKKIIDKSFINSNRYLYIYIAAIKHEDTYNYYYMEPDEDRNYIMDFQEKWLGKIQEYLQKTNKMEAPALDCFLYFLIDRKLDSDQRENCETVSYVLLNGKCQRKIVVDENSYKYEPLL